VKLPSYPKYVASRDTWVGAVPAHWTFLRADFTTASNKEQISDTAMEGIEILHYSIPNVQEFGTAQIEDGNDIDSSKLLIAKRQLLISKLNPRKATVCIAEPHEKLLTVCSGEFVPIIPEGELTVRYCYYTWLSDKVTKLLSSLVQSVTRSHQRVSPEDITKLPWAWPPTEEQQQIAAFLDWKTGQIDALLARKQELLEKLNEKRIALIIQAVTQGLNPAAPMRDSGTPWLGQVPNHWEVRRLKDHGLLVGGAGFPIDEQGLTDEELPFYKVGDLKEAADGRNMIGAPNTISREIADKLRATIVPPNAVVYAKIGAALLLNRRRVTTVPCCIDNNMTAYIPDAEQLEIRWVHYWLSILDFGEFVNPGAVPSFSEGYQSVVPIFVPPLKEQEKIADYLDSALPKIDQLVDATERTIDRLAEYRAALITAATTGKIDVRNVKVPQPAA
jgi:type I restriction enzyme S subunit